MSWKWQTCDMKRSQPFSRSSAKFESCSKLEAVKYGHSLLKRVEEWEFIQVVHPEKYMDT